MSTPVVALIGLDVGTSRVKAVALGLDGTELADFERPTPWRRSAAGTDAEATELADTVRQVVIGAARDPRLAGARIAGVGVTGMAEAGVLLDGADRPTAPVLAWHDRRGDTERIMRDIGTESFQQTVGMLLDPKPSLAKIIWLRTHVPSSADAVRFLSVPEWAVFVLGGEQVSELSLASRTGLLDVAAAKPWAATAELVGGQLLADLVVAGTDCGRLTGDVPESLAGAVLTVAGHDHQTAAFAVGAARPGVLLNSVGTAEALVRCVEPLDGATMGRLAPQDVSCGWGVVPGHYTVLQGVRTGLVLEQVAALLGATTREARRALGTEAMRVAPPPQFAVNEDADGYRLGPLVDGLSPAAVWAAAVRDLTAESARAVAGIDQAIGDHQEVIVVGGWLRNPAVEAAKQRQFPGHRVSRLREAGTAGAAFLAGVAAGVLERPAPDEEPQWR